MIEIIFLSTVGVIVGVVAGIAVFLSVSARNAADEAVFIAGEAHDAAKKAAERAENPRIEQLELQLSDLEQRHVQTHASHKRLLSRVAMRELRERRSDEETSESAEKLDNDPEERARLQSLLGARLR